MLLALLWMRLSTRHLNLLHMKSILHFRSLVFPALAILKEWLTGFFLGLIVFMGCSLACVHACFF